MSTLQVTKIVTVDNTTPLILATGNSGGGQIILSPSNTDVIFSGNLHFTPYVTGDGSGLHLPTTDVANAAFNTANAAYASANNVAPQVTPAFNTANAAFDMANTKFSSSGGTISGSVIINNDLTVHGNTIFVDQQTLQVGDPLIYLAANNYSSDIVDIGFIANYSNTGGQNVHTGLYRSSGNKEYYLFYGYDREPINNYIDPTGNNIQPAILNATVRTGNIMLGGANTIEWIRAAYDKANAGGANVSQTAPTGSKSGSLWWNSDLGKMFIYYTDPANTSSWVEASPSASSIETSIVTGYINPVYNASNAAFASGNASYTTINSAYITANAGYTTANAAFAKANAALANASATYVGALNVVGNVGISSSQYVPSDTTLVLGSNTKIEIGNPGKRRIYSMGPTSSNYQLNVSGGAAILFDRNSGSDEIAFETHYTGYWHREQMRISKEGYVTSPYQPYARVSKGNGNVGGPSVIIFNYADEDTLGMYNTTTGRFTAPVTGRYLFTHGLFTNTGYAAWLKWRVNGTVVTTTYTNVTSGYSSVAGCMILKMNANDYADLYLETPSSSYQIYGNSRDQCWAVFTLLG